MYLLHKKFLIDIIIALKDDELAFNEFQNQLKIYSDTLSRRLKELEECGVIRALVTQEKNRKRVRYSLTDKGKRIAPMLFEVKKLLETVEKEL